MRNAFRYRILFALLVFIVLTALYSACTEKAKTNATNDVTVNAPTQLQAIRNPQGDIVFLQWIDNASDETGYRIERSTTGADSGYQLVTTLQTENVTTYTDSTVPYDLICYFRVVAFSSENESPFSNVATAILNPVNAPVLFPAIRDSATGFTLLMWQDYAINETGFVIERSVLPSDTDFIEIATIPPNTIEYNDTTAPLSVTCSYRMYAKAGALHSAYSDVQSVSAVTLTAPDNLSATRITPTSVELHWNNHPSGETGYLVERSLVSADSGFQYLTTTGIEISTYTDNMAPIDRVAHYRVCTIYHAYHSEYTAVATAPLYTVSAPSSLTATRIQANSIMLHWEDENYFETGFIVERSTTSNTSGFRTIATLGTNVSYFDDNVAPTDSGYFYRVYAVVQSLRSNYSNVATVPFITVRSPAQLVATRRNYNTVDLQWVDSSSNETNFLIERWTLDSYERFREIGFTESNTTVFTDEKAPVDCTYCYRVRARSEFVYSDYSNTWYVNGNARPSKAQLLNPVHNATGIPLGVTLQWSASDPDGDTIFYDVHVIREGSSLEDSIVAQHITGRSWFTGRLALATNYRWGVVAYDAHHPVPAFDIANSNRFTTTNNAASVLDWEDVPHAGLVTLYGNYHLYGYWYYTVGGGGSYDTSYADVMLIDYQDFLLPNGSNGDFSLNGDYVGTFPLWADGTVRTINFSTSFSNYFTHSLVAMRLESCQMENQDVVIGTNTVTCFVLRFEYHFYYLGYGESRTDSALQLFFAPNIGLVKITATSSSSQRQMSYSSYSSEGVTYQITPP